MTDFAKTVKKKLIDLGESQEWLMVQVREKTGLFIDSSYLYKIYSGKRTSPKIKEAICEILEIKEEKYDC